MKRSIRWLIVILSILCIILIISDNLRLNFASNNFKCNGYYSIFFNDISLISKAYVRISGDTGTIVVRGVIKDKSKKLSDIVTSTEVSIKRVNNAFVMTADKNNLEMNGDVDIIKELLPEVFYKKDASIIYDIIPHDGGRYLFVRGGVPVFYCAYLGDS